MFGPRDPIVPEPTKAFTCCITRVDGKPVLTVGIGNHDCVRYELTWSMVASMALDMIPWVVKR